MFWNNRAVLGCVFDLVLLSCIEGFLRKVVEVVPFLLVLCSSRLHEYLVLTFILLDPDALNPRKGELNDFKECELQSRQFFVK